jgi:hypothetical protein
MSGFELRPLSLGELLDRGFTIYRQNFWLFAGITLVPSCFIVPMRFFLLRNRGKALPWHRASPQSHAGLYSLVFIFVYSIIYSFVQAATTCAVADAYLGRSSTIREAYGKIRQRFWRIAAIIINVGIRVWGVFIIGIVLVAVAGGILIYTTNGNVSPDSSIFIVLVLSVVVIAFGFMLWFSMRYSLSFSAALLEGITARDAIRRSVQLTKGRRWQLFVATLLGLVLYYVAVIVFEGPFYAGIALFGIKGQLPNSLVLAMAVSSTLGGIVASPVLVILVVVYYYDMRIRKEGFDLQYMMATLPDTSLDTSSADFVSPT